MAIYLALIRGINVGGHKLVAMADLRGLVDRLGFADARTLLQSGNMVFRGRARRSVDLERMLEAEAKKRFGLEADFFVRTADEWDDVIARNPFPDAATRDPARLLVMFLNGPPDARSVKALQAAIVGPETVRVNGREAYIVYPIGIGRSRLTGALIEKKLGSRGTGRNWNTVLKLGEAARSLASA